MADKAKVFGKTKIIDTGSVTKIQVAGNDLLTIDHASGGVNLMTGAILASEKVHVNATSGVSEKLYCEGDSLFKGGLKFTGTASYLILPSLTSTQRDALTAAAGMMIYNSTTSKAQVYAGGIWNDLY